MRLNELAERLRQPALVSMARGFDESRIAGRRNWVLLLLIAWGGYWAIGEGTTVLHDEGRRVLPYLLGMLALNALWWAALRKGWARGRWIDYAGTAGHFLGIAVLLSVSWNLMLPTVMFLPLGTITAAVRFSTLAFYGWMVFSVLVVGVAAAEGYWQSRPAVAVLALALLIGLPLTVARLMRALEAVSAAAVVEFEEAVKARDTARNFLSTISHELRSPLNAMVNANELLSTENLTESERELADTMRSNGRLLMRRVNDVLDVASLERGSMTLQNGTFNMRNAVGSVITALMQEADSKGVAIGVQMEDAVPEAVIGDVSRFEQVIQNLIENAVKYTPPGGKVDVVMSLRGEDTVVIEVRDTGIGIPDAEKQRIFEPHHQVSQGDARRYGGIGLGLHIVSRLASLMDSVVEVEDNPGGGSVFRWAVTLGRATEEQTRASLRSSVSALDDFRHRTGRLRMLVVDDNASGREMLRRLLERAGQDVVVARNGEEGLACLAREVFDLVLLDLHMPVIDGFEVLQRIRKAPETFGRQTVLVISAVSDEGSIKRAIEFGANHFVTKPILPEALTVAMETALKR